MTRTYVQISWGFTAGAVLGLVVTLPLFAAEREQFNVEGLDRARGPFVGQLELITEGSKLQVVRSVRFRDGGSETTSGVGRRQGNQIRASLQLAVGAEGALRGRSSKTVELRLRLDRSGRCQTRCLEGRSILSKGHGAHPGKELSFAADLGPKGATDGSKKSAKKLQSEHFLERFEGVPFVKGKGDAREIEGNDPEQGALGDCYLVAAMIAVARSDPKVIRRMITSKGGGKYSVKLSGLGSWGRDVSLTVDDTFPSTGKGRRKMLAYVSSTDRKTVRGTKFYELWPSLLEKAYATHKGSFAKIEGGHSDGPFEFISGKSASSYYTFFRNGKDIATLIRNARAKGYPICVGTKSDTGKLGRRLNVTGNHVYVLWGVKGGRYQLYNPWASSHPSRTVTAAEIQKLASHVYVGEF
ncbi:MAG: hypothetical protein JKY65_30215 [Planctomycetes bacterium]|nr:hypothetical protein [Planctomycetota bacterium]